MHFRNPLLIAALTLGLSTALAQAQTGTGASRTTGTGTTGTGMGNTSPTTNGTTPMNSSTMPNSMQNAGTHRMGTMCTTTTGMKGKWDTSGNCTQAASTGMQSGGNMSGTGTQPQ